MAYLFQSGSLKVQLSGAYNVHYSDISTTKRLQVAAGSSSAGGSITLGEDGEGALYMGTGSYLTLQGPDSTGLRFSVGTTNELELRNGVLQGARSNDIDLGASTIQFKDLYLDGIGYIDQLGTDADPSTIYADGGELDAVVIGSETAAQGFFTTLSASSTLHVGAIAYLGANVFVTGSGTTFTATTVDINGGAIDGTAIGDAAGGQASGSFTGISASIAEVTFGAITADTALDVANDGLYFRDNSDSNRLRNVEVGSFLTDIAGSGISVTSNQLTVAGSGVTAHGDTDQVLSGGMNYATAVLGADRVWTLPRCNTLTDGDIYRVKAEAVATYKLIVSPNSNDQIDDLAANISVELESDNSSISLIVVSNGGSGKWRIF